MKLWLLSGGLIDADRSVIHPGDDSHRRVTLPCWQVLIEVGGRRLLIDTGMPPEAVGDREGLQRAYGMEPSWLQPIVTEEEGLIAQLDVLGLQVSDLDAVINTHMHFDHAGGNALTSGIPIAVQREELDAARNEGYLPVWDAPGVQFDVVEGDWSPVPGVEMLHTPGHTPGHQSMLVHHRGGDWLFTWDAVYTEEHWRGDKLGAVADIPRARESLRRLRSIAAEKHARVIFGHDLAQWEALRRTAARGPVLVVDS